MYYDKLILKGYKAQPKFLGCYAGFSIFQFKNWKEFSITLKDVIEDYYNAEIFGYMIAYSYGYYYLYEMNVLGDYDSVAFCHGDGWIMDFDPFRIIRIQEWDDASSHWSNEEFYLLNASGITSKKVPCTGYDQYTEPLEVEGLSIYERHFIENCSDADKFNIQKFFRFIQRITNPLENFALCEQDKRRKEILKYYYPHIDLDKLRLSCYAYA